jgi:hypothetical protein
MPVTPLIVTEVAPTEVQVNVELPPGAIVVGAALTVIETGLTLTVTVWVAVPPGPVAVAV